MFDEAELTKAKILTNWKRLERLPTELLKPQRCPICNGKMEGLEVTTRMSYYECVDCGFKQPSLDIKTAGTDVASLAAALGLGALFGLGLAALLHLLAQGERREIGR